MDAAVTERRTNQTQRRRATSSPAYTTNGIRHPVVQPRPADHSQTPTFEMEPFRVMGFRIAITDIPHAVWIRPRQKPERPFSVGEYPTGRSEMEERQQIE